MQDLKRPNFQRLKGVRMDVEFGSPKDNHFKPVNLITSLGLSFEFYLFFVLWFFLPRLFLQLLLKQTYKSPIVKWLSIAF